MSLSFVQPGLLWLLLLVPLTAGLALLGRRRKTGRFWASLGLRVLLLTLIVAALAGLQVRRRADTLTAVFVLDVSDSVPAEEQARGEALIREAVEAMPAGDRAAVVVFGEDALVERLATEVPSPGPDHLGAAHGAHRHCQRAATGHGPLARRGRQAPGAALGRAREPAPGPLPGRAGRRTPDRAARTCPSSGPQGEAEVLIEAPGCPGRRAPGAGL